MIYLVYDRINEHYASYDPGNKKWCLADIVDVAFAFPTRKWAEEVQELLTKAAGFPCHYVVLTSDLKFHRNQYHELQ